jgi:hypothetical protein
MGRKCSTYGGDRGMHTVFVGKPEGERPLGRPRHRWDNNIEMVLREIGCGLTNWINLVQNTDW